MPESSQGNSSGSGSAARDGETTSLLSPSSSHSAEDSLLCSVRSYSAISPQTTIADLASSTKRSIESNVPPRLIQLLKYSRVDDYLLLSFGVFAALIESAIVPTSLYLFGHALQAFVDVETHPPANRNRVPPSRWAHWPESYLDVGFLNGGGCYGNVRNATTQHDSAAEICDHMPFIRHIMRYAFYLALVSLSGIFVGFWRSYIFIDRTAAFILRMRQSFFKSLLLQDLPYVDNAHANRLVHFIEADFNKLESALPHLGGVISSLSTIALCLAFAFWQSYMLSAIAIAGMIFAILIGNIGFGIINKYSSKSRDDFLERSLLKTVTTSIRSIHAYGIMQRILNLYNNSLLEPELMAAKAGTTDGLVTGALCLLFFCFDGLVIVFGIRLYKSGEISYSTMMMVLFSLLQCAWAFELTQINAAKISASMPSLANLLSTIRSQKASVKNASEPGRVVDYIRGDVEFRSVHFSYPHNVRANVLQNFSLHLTPGQSVALVGPPGAGKSTVLSVLQKFYQPTAGSIFIDGEDIRDMDTAFLLRSIAYISSDLPIFSDTIWYNVSSGLIGTEFQSIHVEVKLAMVVDACMQAGVWDFICGLPKGLATPIGATGMTLTDGQRLRIALARSIVADPRILLWDDTLVKDPEEQRQLEKAFKRASKGRTTIFIPHSAASAAKCDTIAILENGNVVMNDLSEDIQDQLNQFFSHRRNGLRCQRNDSFESLASWLSEESANSSQSDAEIAKARAHESQSDAAGASSDIQSTPQDCIEIRELSWELCLSWIGLDALVSVFHVVRLKRRDLWLGVIAGGLSGFIYIGYFLMHGILAQVFQAYGHSVEGFEKIEIAGYLIAGAILVLGVALGGFKLISCRLIGIFFGQFTRAVQVASLEHILQSPSNYEHPQIADEELDAMVDTVVTNGRKIAALGGPAVRHTIECMTVLCVGFCFAIFLGHQMAFTLFSVAPAAFLVGYMRYHYMANFTVDLAKENRWSLDYISAVMKRFKVVLLQAMAKDLVVEYSTVLARFRRGRRVWAKRYAVAEGLTCGLKPFVMGLGFWYGGQFVVAGNYSLFRFFTIYLLSVRGIEKTAQVFKYAPEMMNALAAARTVSTFADDDDFSENSYCLGYNEYRLDIKLKNVRFSYTTESVMSNLRDLSLEALHGDFIAIVGAEELAGSSIIGLIEGFNKPSGGDILFNGRSIGELDLASYRDRFSMVKRDEVLYKGSIRYNIALGALDEDVSEDEIISACIIAQVHDFITSLPDGYDTICDEPGLPFTAGQIQRVAIARALVRNPQVLLLDNPTGGLENEALYATQVALKSASKNRTTIAVTDRISVAKMASRVYVMDRDRVVESGTHEQLVMMREKYFQMLQNHVLH
ncbi:P-loop containing nucleoside triphosphate hydrolase protein [Limtongia smithiae]|uniref:P-loop containing nucleoside triphosphate hydrolase protein n=1 Tax=Limtongia smithiae TaxID=1125753 RepID=UPI0034CE395E